MNPSASARTWRSARDELEKRLAAEKDPLVRQDLEILIAQTDRDIRSSEASERICCPMTTSPERFFTGSKSLLDEQIAADRGPRRWFACANTPAWIPPMSRSPCRPSNAFAKS